MSSRRASLDAVRHQADTNAGLWLDRFLPEQTREGAEGGKGAKAKLILEAGEARIPDGYREALARWKAELEESGAVLAEAVTRGRLIAGLGGKGVIEAGIHLDRTWGVPVLRGSALKGLAAAAARGLVENGEDWHPVVGAKEGGAGVSPNSYETLFGTTEESGAVRFLDAWWIPGDGEVRLPIDLDVMTVHHADYYRGREGAPPSDGDSPNPVAFATTRGRFLLALEGPREWCEAALLLLERGLGGLGLGAKTGSGYGRADVKRVKSREDMLREELQGELEQIRPETVDAKVLPLLEKHAERRREVALAIVRRLRSLGKKGKWFREKAETKAWAKALVEAAGAEEVE